MTIAYSREDILRMIAEQHLDPKDLPSRRLSQFQVIIEVPNKSRFDVLTLPAGYEDDALLDLVLYYFTLPDYAIRLNIGPKRLRNNAVKSFLKFLKENQRSYLKNNTQDGDDLIYLLPSLIFSDWFKHLKNHETPNKTYLFILVMTKMLETALVHRFGKVSTWPGLLKDASIILRESIPRQPQSTKKPPLGRFLGIPESLFSNQELQMGLRYGVIWLMQHFHKFRQAMLSEAVISEALEQTKGCTLNEARKKFENWNSCLYNSKAPHINLNVVRKVFPAAWKCIQDDPLLAEWQFYCLKKLRPALAPNEFGDVTPFSQKQHQLLLNRFVRADGSIRFNAKGYGPGDKEWFPLKPYLGPAGRGVKIKQPCIWGIEWIVPTLLEELAMQWMLASERAQKSGIKSLTIDSVHKTENSSSLQISTLKMRRSKNAHAKRRHTDVESAIYKRRTPPFEIYSNWLNLKKQAQVQLKNHNPKGRYVEGLIAGMICQATHSQITNTYLPLELISVPGTVWHDTFLSDAGIEASREAQAFIAILQNRVALKRNNPDKHIQLPVGPIGESLVVEIEAESNRSVKIDGIMGVAAEVAGHSEATGRNTYKDGYARIGITEIIEPVRAFARKVGDAKIELAEQIAERLAESNRKVSIEELEKLCGIHSSRIDQTTLLSRLDEQEKLTIAGEILNGNETLIIETDMTAGMMWGYIQHLEGQLPSLLASDREDICTRYLAQLIHYHQVFESFDDKLKQSGRRIAAEIDFPFPSLS
ncbi:hypothetical protein [Methylomicrobium lacus]|uniref:hypothetical protein n=1 Tax=Methylomicrobium lacus TaxID=136992 RepID=UPI00045E6742|nr:hypothetical protein [Methylomicrobium lacus]